MAGTVVRAERGALILQRETEPGQGVMVRLTLASACEPEGLEISEALFHYLLGNDPDKWHTHVPSFASLRYPDAWPGIDLVVRDAGDALMLELVGGTDHELSTAEIEREGAEAVELSDDGRALLRTWAGTLALRARWKRNEATMVEPLEFADRASGVLGFGPGLPRQAASASSVAQSGDLLFSTFLGSPDGIGEGARGIGLDSRGNLVVVGLTDGTAFPVTPGAFRMGKGDRDVTVSILSDKLGLLFSTVIGGTESDRATAVALAPGDLPVVVGRTTSPDFPTSPGAFDTVKDPIASEAFVLCLSQDGDALVFSTYFGEGLGPKEANAVAVRPDGAIVVGGFTGGPSGIPTTPGAFATSGSSSEGFVSVFAPDGQSLVWSTLLGGSSGDEVNALAVLPDSSVLVAGSTVSTDFPVTPGAFDLTKGGSEDAFVLRLLPDGSDLVWSSYLGGAFIDEPGGIGFDASGRVFVVGRTNSANFPKPPGAFDNTYAGDFDGFVTCFEADGSGLVYSTLIGGPNPEFLTSVDVDPSGIATVVGSTISSSFPTTLGAWDQTYGGQQDGFVFRLDANGGNLLYSTFLSGSFLDSLSGGALGCEGRMSVAGDTSSLDYPTTPGAPFPAFQGSQGDQVVSVLGMLPSGVARLGSSGVSCLGETILYPASQPVSDSSAFGFRVSGAPPSSAGVLLLGLGALSSPLPIGEAELWLDPLAPLWPIALSANKYGYVSLPLPLGSDLRGVVFYVQTLFLATASCPARGGLLATGALRLEVQ